MVAKNYNYDVNMLGNEIQNGVFQNVPQNPENPKTWQFDRWVYANGVKLNGLVKRREAEKELFLSWNHLHLTFSMSLPYL